MMVLSWYGAASHPPSLYYNGIVWGMSRGNVSVVLQYGYDCMLWWSYLYKIV